MIIDQNSDPNGKLLYQISQKFDLPEFIKNASSDKLRKPAAFADLNNAKFPCPNKAATWLSTAYFYSNDDYFYTKEASYTEETLRLHCKYFGIEDEFNKLRNETSKRFSKLASLEVIDDDFAVNYKTAYGKVIQKYPIRNKAEVEKLAEYIQEYRSNIPLEIRHQMCQKLVKKAAALNISFDDNTREFLDKQLGYGACSKDSLKELLNTRKVLLKMSNCVPQEDIDTLTKTAEFCETDIKYVKEKSKLLKLAMIIDYLDRAHNLRGAYQKLSFPEDVLFGVTTKVASEYTDNYCHTVTGNTYKITDLEKLAKDDIETLLGTDFLDEITTGGLFIDGQKFATVLHTLPRPEAALIDKLLGEKNIFPI